MISLVLPTQHFIHDTFRLYMLAHAVADIAVVFQRIGKVRALILILHHIIW